MYYYFCAMSRRNTKQIFKNIEVIDTAAKGKSVGKAPDGRVIFLSNTVPGDVVDVQTLKKRKAYYEGKAIAFHSYSEKRTQPKCEHLELVVVANGRIWIININWPINKMKSSII